VEFSSSQKTRQTAFKSLLNHPLCSGIKNKRVSILTVLKEIMASSKEARQVYAPKEILQLGETLFMNDFAETLAYLAERGKRNFMKRDCSTVGERLPNYGGYLTLEDLKNYQVIEETTTHHRLSQQYILTNPPLVRGITTFALELLSQVDLDDGFGTSRHLQTLAEACV